MIFMIFMIKRDRSVIFCDLSVITRSTAVPAAVSIVLPTPPMPWLEIRDFGAVSEEEEEEDAGSSAASSAASESGRDLKLDGNVTFTRQFCYDNINASASGPRFPDPRWSVIEDCCLKFNRTVGHGERTFTGKFLRCNRACCLLQSADAWRQTALNNIAVAGDADSIRFQWFGRHSQRRRGV